MKCKIIGWAKIKPKKTNEECYVLHTTYEGEKGFNGLKTRVFFAGLDTAEGLERVKLPVYAELTKDALSNHLEVVLCA